MISKPQTFVNRSLFSNAFRTFAVAAEAAPEMKVSNAFKN
jgi:hypothetical protein